MPESRGQELHDSSLGVLDYVVGLARRLKPPPYIGSRGLRWAGWNRAWLLAGRESAPSRFLNGGWSGSSGRVTGRPQYSVQASVETPR